MPLTHRTSPALVPRSAPLLRSALVALAALQLVACARFRPMYDDRDDRPSAAPPLPTEAPAYSVYFTGSAGGASGFDEAPALALARDVLATAGEEAHMLFLGDNLYPRGMPKKDHGDRAAREAQLDLQLEVVEAFPGRAIWLHGDRDWRGFGMDGVEREEDYLEGGYRDGEENVMLPKNACGDPEIVELADDLALLIINSQWFLADWSQYRELNEGCLAQSRKYFRWQLGQAAKELRFKHVIVAMHHPMMSRGPRGGEHGWGSYFRFRDGAGGPIGNFFSTKVGTAQDLYAPRMVELRDMIAAVFDEHPSVTFVSGHEHLLQVGRYEGHPVVGSGTATRVSPGKVGQRTNFTAGVPGLAALHYYDTGEAWLEITGADGTPDGQPLYRERLYTREEPVYEGDYEIYESDRDSIAYAPFAGYREFGDLYRWSFGENNKKLFTTPYTYPILRLDEFAGGVFVSDRGGGGQTNSLRLEDSLGRDYALRSVRKDPTRLLPANVRVGPVITLTQDIFFSANPFAAVTAAALAEAADYPHANPRMYYLPAQPGLGDLNAAFADDLYILEERPVDEWVGTTSPLSGAPVFGAPQFPENPRKIDGRDDVQEKIREGYKDRIDQAQLLRGRLIDLLLGDFDRHDDQWRYAEFKDEETGVSEWRVIPRDRDQALLRVDGKLLKVAQTTLPAVRQTRGFGPDVRYPTDFTFQARFLDRRFLNELTREEWLAVARDLQASITDEEIGRAFDLWPAEVREEYRRDYAAALRQRRDDLLRYAEEQYAFFAEHVYVVGSDEADRFEVERRGDGSVEVSVYELKEGEPVYRTYHRVFLPDETKDVQLFGLRDEDEYIVTGEAEGRSIKIRIVPGPEDDVVRTEDRARGLRRRTRVYAWPGEDELDVGPETEVHTTRNHKFNHYDYRDVDYDYGLWLPALGFNPDDGLKLGLSYQRHHFTFHRKFRQGLNATFATASLGLRFDYTLLIENLAPRLDLELLARYQTPSFAINYFGRGNETIQPLSGDNAQFRIRQELFGFYPGLTIRHRSHDGGLTFSLLGEAITIERDPERILGRERGESAPVFDTHVYGGAGARYEFYNVDDRRFPRDGIHVVSDYTFRRRDEPNPDNVHRLNASVAVYQHLWRNAMVGTRLGGGLTRGDYFFYLGQVVGRNEVRGYRRERFLGDEAIYANVDLRQMIGKALYTRFGVFASFDVGRVFLDALPSDKWHHSYGGGVIIRPPGLPPFSLGLHHPEDGSPTQFKVAAGFDF